MTPREILVQGADRLGIALDAGAVEALEAYMAELLRWNRRINLVARGTSATDLAERHVLDSLTPLLLMEEGGGTLGRETRLMDVGSGAGLPGLVLKIARPGLRALLLEPRARRAAFLRHAVRLLGLEQVEVHELRAEEFPRPAADRDAAGQPPHWILSRALCPPQRFVSLAAPLAGPATRILCMLGPDQDSAAPRPERGLELRLPFRGARRRLEIYPARHGEDAPT